MCSIAHTLFRHTSIINFADLASNPPPATLKVRLRANLGCSTSMCSNGHEKDTESPPLPAAGCTIHASMHGSLSTFAGLAFCCHCCAKQPDGGKGGA